MSATRDVERRTRAEVFRDERSICKQTRAAARRNEGVIFMIDRALVRKARALVKYVQGTMALEGQGIRNPAFWRSRFRAIYWKLYIRAAESPQPGVMMTAKSYCNGPAILTLYSTGRVLYRYRCIHHNKDVKCRFTLYSEVGEQYRPYFDKILADHGLEITGTVEIPANGRRLWWFGDTIGPRHGPK